MHAPDIAESPSVLSERELVERVRKAWAIVLDLADEAAVPIDTNFLEAGGNSLMLIMLWEELHGLTKDTLRVSDLFAHSTVRSQATLLAGGHNQRQLARVGASDRQRLLDRVTSTATHGAKAT